MLPVSGHATAVRPFPQLTTRQQRKALLQCLTSIAEGTNCPSLSQLYKSVCESAAHEQVVRACAGNSKLGLPWPSIESDYKRRISYENEGKAVQQPNNASDGYCDLPLRLFG